MLVETHWLNGGLHIMYVIKNDLFEICISKMKLY